MERREAAAPKALPTTHTIFRFQMRNDLSAEPERRVKPSCATARHVTGPL